MNASAYTITLPSEITASTAVDIAQQLYEKASHSATLCIDASGLQHFDSSALAMLLTLRREAHARQQQWQLVGASPRLLELAQLYGVRDVLLKPVQRSSTV